MPSLTNSRCSGTQLLPMPINLQSLIDDAKCYETIRHLGGQKVSVVPKCDSKGL